MDSGEAKRLLVEFCEWLICHPTARLREESIDAFLASRQPQVTPTAPEPARFWRVLKDYGGWYYVQCYADGKHRDGTTIYVRDTESAARADGIASGLPEWKP